MKSKEKFGLPEMYRFFKKKFTREERQCSAFIDYKTYAAVIKEFNKELARMLIEESIEFKMPLRLGFIRIRKFKRKTRINPDGSVDLSKLRINWQETIKLWDKEYPGITKEVRKEIHNKPLIYHLNEHTDGYSYYLYWSKKGSNVINRSVYTIDFTFTNDRYLAHVLKSNSNIDYYE